MTIHSNSVAQCNYNITILKNDNIIQSMIKISVVATVIVQNKCLFC